MKLITKTIFNELLANGKKQLKSISQNIDFKPVVKLFTPDAAAIWLLTEIDPHTPDIAFGLCDLGLRCPELGYVSIREIEEVRGSLNLPVEREICFIANKTLSQYAKEAKEHGRIIA